MEAINNRLKQLEDIEARLYLGKEAIVQRRAREDEQLQLKRQEEDRDFLETLRERDQEEDELRRKRRILIRSSFGPLAAQSRDHGSRASPDLDHGPLTRSKTKVKRSASKTVPSSSSGRKEYGPPTARDSQGRDLFTRPSGRQVAPGQEEDSTTARDQLFGAAPVANMARAGILPSPSTGSDEYHRQSKASSRSISDAEARSGATFSKTMEPFKAQDLGRAYRTRSSHHGSQTEPRTRTKEAAEVFNGFMSSDSEDRDENEDGPPQNRKISADMVDQHKAANMTTYLSTRLRADITLGRISAKAAGGDPALVVLAVDDQAIKKERSTSPSLLLEQSQRRSSPKTLVFAPEAEHVPSFKTAANHLMPNLGSESIATRKRASSAPPVTPSAITKRRRLTDKNLERLVCSYSGVAIRPG